MGLTNREIKYLRSLHQKKYRLSEKRFLCGGVRLLEEAVESDYLPAAVYFSPAQLTDRGMRLVARFSRKKVETIEISNIEGERIVGTKSFPGVVALFSIREAGLEQQLALKPRKILVCDRINDPGNLGTLMRSAAAFDFELVITTAGSAELTNPKTVRAGMGAYFMIPAVPEEPDKSVREKLGVAGYEVFCAESGGRNIKKVGVLPSRLALVIGSETLGVSPVFRGGGRNSVSVPMSEKTESLNAAIAGSILMYWFNSRAGASK